METFELRHVSFSYPQRPKALDDVSLTIRQGEFLVLCGPSGCGKSTLLRQLKPALTPSGTREGTILFHGAPVEGLDMRTQSSRIGFVLQNPENQAVTDKVWHELSFGPESLGWDTPSIRRRVAETASFFGIQNWFHLDVAQLSGGQKQLLNLASVMVMQPDVLILDEPTSQLDPIAAGEFLAALGRINRELGTTVVLSEHRLEDALPLAGRLAVLDGGRLLCVETPAEAGARLSVQNHPMFQSMPTPMRVQTAVERGCQLSVCVREGRQWLEDYAIRHTLSPLPGELVRSYPGGAALEGHELWFRYERNAPDTVKGASITAQKGEFLALLGGNGTGKTTCLKLLAGLLTPYRGSVQTTGRMALLPQDPQTLFVKSTALGDLEELSQDPLSIDRVVALCRLRPLLDRHPYDLSGGEQQRLALAKVLLTQPDILLLDEPTKGMDEGFKRELGAILHTLCAQGSTVVMVSHDVEFCARYAHRCALFFDGGIVTQDTPRRFFSGNRFYTTAANRMAHTVLPQAVTAEELICACGGTVPPPPERPDRLPPARTAGHTPAPPPAPKRKLSLPARLACLSPLLLIPPLLLFGPGGSNYHLTALLVLGACMLPFFLAFEGRRPRARELVLAAALCAIGVAGRAALFMLPQFKPILALTVLAGVALGCETGFLVGAATMLVSNMLLAQGPWTPWQMFAMGLVGFLAGTLFRSTRPGRAELALFGAAAALLVYGGIMNAASYLMWAGPFNWRILLAYYISGFPMDCVHAAATAFFLWLCSDPMLG